MTTTITTESGRTRELPEHVKLENVLGLDQDGRIVIFEEWMGDYAFGLTLPGPDCPGNAWDKGCEDGVFCRRCFGDHDTGNYLPRTPAGHVLGLDKIKKA